MKNLLRNILFLVVLIAANTACRKKYNCHCVTTVSDPYRGQDYFNSKTKPLSEKMSKKQAKGVCDHEAESINESYENAITYNGTFSSNGVTAVTNCNLQ